MTSPCKTRRRGRGRRAEEGEGGGGWRRRRRRSRRRGKEISMKNIIDTDTGTYSLLSMGNIASCLSTETKK